MEITYTNTDETWRENRIQKIVDATIEFKPDVATKIKRLHDHKGTLEVHWLINNPDEYIVFIDQLWSAQNECSTEHYKPDGKPIN